MARNKYPEETRKLIVQTARRLFIEKGYEHTSIQDIIDHLGGLSKGAIYHHFKSKEDIMYAVAEDLYSGTDLKMSLVNERKDLNGIEKLKLMIRTSVFGDGQIEMFEAGPDMLESPMLLTRYFQDSVQKEGPEVIRPLIEEGIADGSIQTQYPQEMAEVLMLIGSFWINPLIYHCSVEEYVRKLECCQEILKNIGLDIIDDHMIDKIKEYYQIYSDHKNK